MNLFPDYTPRPEPKKPARFADPEPRRQKMLLSGLDLPPGTRDLFDVDGGDRAPLTIPAPQGIQISDHADGIACSVAHGGETIRFLVYRRPGETVWETRGRAERKAAEHLAELQAIAAEAAESK